MTDKKQKISKKLIIGSALAIVAIIGAVGYFVLAQSPPKPLVFSFNQDLPNSWYAVPNYHSRAEAIADGYSEEQKEGMPPAMPIDEIPVTYRGVFEGKPGESSDGCFVLFDYHDKPTDVTALYQKKLDQIAEFNTPDEYYATKELSLDTPDGKISYQLQQYEVVAPSSEPYKQGYAWAYVGLPIGYISITGVCDTVEELDKILPILDIISLEKQA
jgi:hypothetical protein